MKKACGILAIICMVLAIVCMVLNIVSVKPRVSEMSDWRLGLFLRQYGLEEYDDAELYPTIRTWALDYEVGYDSSLAVSYTPPLLEALNAALEEYYGKKIQFSVADFVTNLP